MNRSTFFLINILFFVASCSSNSTIDEQVIANSPTHPNVTQRPAKKNKNVKPGDPRFRPIKNSTIETVQVPSGSLFKSKRSIGIYPPKNNYKIGDMILIKIAENTSANKSINYKTKKKDHFELQPVTFNAGHINIGNDDLNAEYQQKKTLTVQHKQNKKTH